MPATPITLEGTLRCTNIVTPTIKENHQSIRAGKHTVARFKALSTHSSRFQTHISSILNQKRTVNSYAPSTPCSVDHCRVQIAPAATPLCLFHSGKSKKEKNFSHLAISLMQEGQQSMVKGIHPYIQRSKKRPYMKKKNFCTSCRIFNQAKNHRKSFERDCSNALSGVCVLCDQI